MSGRPAVPYHCPFCGEEDLRPDTDDASAWGCRSCARVFTVTMLRLDRQRIPGHLDPVREGGSPS